MTDHRDRCTCHDLSPEAFRAACDAGCTRVKGCFQYHRCQPKCGKCSLMVRRILSDFQASDDTHSAEYVTKTHSECAKK